MPARRAATRALAICTLLLAACGEGTPVAPTGSILRLSANPSRIDATGTSTITIQALRVNGNPVNPGTEVRLATDLGTIDPVVYTDQDGVALATLRGDGRAGTATVSAYSGDLEPAEIEVRVGAFAAAITLTVDPASLPISGGRVTLRALVRDDLGEPIVGAPVVFGTEAGRLASGGGVVRTDASGLATDRLNVSASDAESHPGGIRVSAETLGEGGNQLIAEATIVIREP
jgi:hypothetical protein